MKELTLLSVRHCTKPLHNRQSAMAVHYQLTIYFMLAPASDSWCQLILPWFIKQRWKCGPHLCEN